MANEIQGDLFGGMYDIPENPLKGRRVGFVGKFKNRAALIRKVKDAYGASGKSNDTRTRDTSVVVFGADVSSNDRNKNICYIHDGWKALCLTEADLQNIFNGNYDKYEAPVSAQKHIEIDMSYYYWDPPYYSGKDEDGQSTTRVSSPLIYGEDNPVLGKEIYVPDHEESNIMVLRQIIGNLGGYANAEYFEDTNIVLLPDATLDKLKNGVRDSVIRHIEDMYNSSSSPVFNVQFTSESELISWVEKRVEKFGDVNTKKLLDLYRVDRS